MKKEYQSPELDYIIYHTPDIMNILSWLTGSGNSGGADGDLGTDGNENGWT